MQSTRYPEINQLLAVLLSRMSSILRERLAGLYLYGSLVLGDFNLEISDIDLLAATTTEVDDGEATALGQMHADIAGQYPQWDNRIEVQYFSLAGLKTFRTQNTAMAVISPGEPFHIVEAGKEWLMNWYFVREKGVVLFGVPPRTIIGPISKEEFIQAAVQHATSWPEWITGSLHSRPYQGYMILTMCRALYLYENGAQVSKKQAAGWAAKELPQWASLIEDAVRWRSEARQAKEIDNEATFPQTRLFVEYVSSLMSLE